ncbi:MAG: ribose-5-phosphate isomerase RpiA [Isosphaeraceae bacterium]
MSETSAGKIQAAKAAADLVEPGMIVGLGSGTTAMEVVRVLGDRLRDEGLAIQGVATSEATAERARSLGIPLTDLDDVDGIDLVIDGADRIDTAFRMIKGRGGALLREKIVACVAKRRVIVVTPEKRVAHLGGAAPLPVEVSPMGTRHIEGRLRDLGARTALRALENGRPFHTDGGNRIVDCHFDEIDDPARLDQRLKGVVGVFETGLFLGLCDLLIVGHADRVERIDATAAEE